MTFVEILNILAYPLIVIGLFLICFSVIKIKRIFDIKEEEIDLMKFILLLGNEVSGKFEFKYKHGINTIIAHCIEALKFVDKFEKTVTREEYIELVKEKAIMICDTKGIELDDGIVEVIDIVVDTIFGESERADS